MAESAIFGSYIYGCVLAWGHPWVYSSDRRKQGLPAPGMLVKPAHTSLALAEDPSAAVPRMAHSIGGCLPGFHGSNTTCANLPCRLLPVIETFVVQIQPYVAYLHGMQVPLIHDATAKYNTND